MTLAFTNVRFILRVSGGVNVEAGTVAALDGAFFSPLCQYVEIVLVMERGRGKRGL